MDGSGFGVLEGEHHHRQAETEDQQKVELTHGAERGREEF
jgi:hypothetical protein